MEPKTTSRSYVFLPWILTLRRESRATRLRIRDAARPALRSHVARGSEGKFKQ